MISQLEVRQEKTKLKLLEMSRDQAGTLVEIKPFEPNEEGEQEVESPLLSALVEDFRIGKDLR